MPKHERQAADPTYSIVCTAHLVFFAALLVIIHVLLTKATILLN
jgi:hypothetical protein